MPMNEVNTWKGRFYLVCKSKPATDYKELKGADI